jgi:succinoglycan biosynthesis transport protein ExoP
MTPSTPAISNPTVVKFGELLKTLKQNWLLWCVPTLLFTAVALAYALNRLPTWQATQALLVRDEAGGGVGRQGRFDNIDAMKTAQETLVEISKNQRVVTGVLNQVGPPAGEEVSADWPDAIDIKTLQDAISLNPPKGAEFGRTEVLYLAVKAHDPDRAIELSQAVCDQMEARLQELRDAKAKSITAELARTVDLAQADLSVATKQLETIETEVGSDLGELRVLNESGAGESNLRSSLNAIKNELRQASTARDANEQQLKLLFAAQKDTNALVATPSRLLESQPALKRLKEGLVDAQLRTAQLLGSMSADHPQAQAARSAEQEVRHHLRNELESAIRGLTADLKVSESQIASLERQVTDAELRLSRLARLRARYGNLVAEVRQCNATLERAQKDLADARASGAAAHSASLVTRLDSPQVGNGPIGPGKTVIVGSGFLGGLICGLGLVFLTVPTSTGSRGRRLTDYLGFGRRASDKQGNRRGDDHAGRQEGSGDRGQGTGQGKRRETDAPGKRRESDFVPPAVVVTPVPAETSPCRERQGDRRGSGDRRNREEPQTTPTDEAVGTA